MEYQKITNLLGNIPDKVPRFIVKKWIEVHDQFGGAYNASKQTKFKASLLSLHLCDYSDAYIVVKENIIATNPNNNAYDKKVALKNNAPCVFCISAINNTVIDNAEDLDIVIAM